MIIGFNLCHSNDIKIINNFRILELCIHCYQRDLDFLKKIPFEAMAFFMN